MYKALYRKYRPLTFSDVVGQEHITTTLMRQVSTGNISHAYLFTGSRGTGKTTCAKILARAINCLNSKNGNPCDECEVCKGILNESIPDVIEMDAASNNGVDYIRELRERIVFAPVKANYKVYIIDEVHMLSASAANALLKTLEEPPKHAVFILATTEVNAILPTILSRCQRFDFHRIEPSVIADRLKYVADKENITLSDEAAMLIASIADGGMRDALSILDLCLGSGNNITEDIVNSVCGKPPIEYIFSLADNILKNDAAKALITVNELYKKSIDMMQLCRELCDFYRNTALICSGVKVSDAVAVSEENAKKYQNFAKEIGIESCLHCVNVFFDALSQMNNSNRRSVLETAIIKLSNPRLDSSNDALLARIAALESRFLNNNITAAVPRINETEQKIPDTKEPKTPQKDTAPITRTAPLQTNQDGLEVGKLRPMAEWNDIVSACLNTAPIIFGLLNGSKGYLNGQTIIIRSDSVQVRNMLLNREDMNYKGLCEAIRTVTGHDYIPVMEKGNKTKKDDPMLGFIERLNNL